MASATPARYPAIAWRWASAYGLLSERFMSSSSRTPSTRDTAAAVAVPILADNDARMTTFRISKSFMA
ncbi:hypothetical protein CFB45_13155 [Burkholderia sp. HI2500]|nr:hypothetical protein CFB45_13155 [Burkholderia sp. HI2500]